MSTAFDFKTLPEDQQVAYYGCLFALAAADGEIDKDEAAGIYETLDTEGMSRHAKQQIHGFMLTPPPFEQTLALVAAGPRDLRYGLMLMLVEVALADGAQTDEEAELLEGARRKLDIREEQLAEIIRFVREVQRVRARGIDDNVAAEAFKQAAAGLGGVGVPLAAVYFSGAVVGLSAAGVTSGLAALGLGFGMVPGIGTAILLGTAIYFGVSWLLDSGNKNQKAQLQAERERRAQLVIRNLQEAINLISDRLLELQGAAEQSQKNEAALRSLTQRLRALQHLLSQRRERIEGMA